MDDQKRRQIRALVEEGMTYREWVRKKIVDGPDHSGHQENVHWAATNALALFCISSFLAADAVRAEAADEDRQARDAD